MPIKIKGNLYVQAERFAQEAQASGSITRFQVQEYLAEFYRQATGTQVPFEYSTPKEFFRRWNGAKRASITAFKERKASEASVVHHLKDDMPIELQLRELFKRIK